MANNEAKEGVLEILFPFKGYNTSTAHKNQPSLSTSIILNCRIKDVSENRARGGQRPGLSKAFDEQVGTTQPVLKMVSINTTYIPPEEA
jgi:hypothetical protein